MKLDACCGGAAIGIEFVGLDRILMNDLAKLRSNINSRNRNRSSAKAEAEVGAGSGAGWNYATATRGERDLIAARVRYYVQGLMYFWANDESVPERLREKHRSTALCKDEWPGTVL